MPADRFALDEDLDGRILAPIFKSLCAAGHSGVLEVRSNGLVLDAILVDGQPVFARSNDREDRLGAVIMRRNALTLPEMVTAVERMLKEKRRLGEILVRDGFLDARGLTEALRCQILEIFCRMLILRQGHVRFRAQAPMDHDRLLVHAPNELIHQAFFRVRAFYTVLDDIGGLTATYRPTDRFFEELTTVKLPSDQNALIPHLEHPINLHRLCDKAPISGFDVCRLVWVLLVIGALSRLE
ncbi:MAG: DUF4388 domain-containing protein [Acidobacteriota bacterium]